jgi:hypothetical protein
LLTTQARSAFADALNSLSYHQASFRMPESLVSAADAVALQRLSFAESPKLAAQALSRSLNTLSDMQADMGFDQEALASIEEALSIHRRLYREHAIRHAGDLAGHLLIASLRYLKLGRISESNACRSECQELCRASENTRRKIIRNIKAGLARRVLLDTSDGVDFMRSLQATLEPQFEVRRS